uniref:50S ribosomal protein L34, chloroplastic n=1 Tax=Nelumbo nucifera TaxID=4432 RepID=A0A822YWM4_NELNU|nr:TPA_asm: hypothetical protein HUJ06_007561 [Nelumbo nucifera]
MHGPYHEDMNCSGLSQNVERQAEIRRRRRTTSGRAVLKHRRAKGRKVLCPKSNPNSGKRA